jgi:HK97 family phage major capsid protein
MKNKPIQWAGIALLAVLGVCLGASLWQHPELLLGAGLIVPFAGARRFLRQEGGEGGGGGEAFEQKVLAGVEALQKKSSELATKIADLEKKGESAEQFRKEFEAAQQTLLGLQKAMLSVRRNVERRPGQVSEECARTLGAIAALRGINKGLITDGIDRVKGLVGEVLGKAALTTSDIPLPVDYSGEVVELVSQFGAARRFGTVFPLTSGTVKLPKLKTSPAFGLIAMSAAAAQKSPQFEFVNFAAEKWGGLVILPNEIDEDSVVAVGQFIARYSAREMAKIEDVVFFTADGTATYDSLEGLTKSVVTDSKTVALASTKTKISDVTLAKLRELRTTVDAAALGMGAYYFHPTMEQALSGMNTSGDKPYVANGIQGATLDGFPIRWVDVLPAYSTSASASTVFGLFGDVSFQYLGARGGMRFDISDAPGFANDQLYIRALERFTIGKMATGAVGGIITAAS